jgi:hypothetical protein
VFGILLSIATDDSIPLLDLEKTQNNKSSLMHKDSKCPAMKALTFPLDRQGTLYVDGEMHSTGLFDLKSGLYVSSIEYGVDIPPGNAIVLLADEGEHIDIEHIERCPTGEAHHHFTTE